jgi:hypothetical protein
MGAAAPDVDILVLLSAGLHFAGTRWLRTRKRRADLRWQAALVLPDGVRPGLLGRWSWVAVAVNAVGTTGFVLGGLVFFGGRVGADSIWFGVIGSIAAGAGAIVLADGAFRRLRRSGHLAITSGGVAVGDEVVGWDQIEMVRRDRRGVHLRQKTPKAPRNVQLTAPDCAVSDDRLAEVVEFYLANPHRRSALDTGPDQFALPARQALGTGR